MIGHCTTTNYASLYPLGFPHILDGGGSRGVPTASPSDPSSITKGTAPADAPASSPPFLPMAYDFILTCRDSVVAGAILLRLDPSIHETFVPIAMDGLGNYTHRLYLALSLIRSPRPSPCLRVHYGVIRDGVWRR